MDRGIKGSRWLEREAEREEVGRSCDDAGRD
jgi:hypothetical protein